MVREGVQPVGSEVRGSPAEYEEAIRQVREVTAVRVVTDVRGGVDEIHVLAGAGRGAKQIVRDIESTLMAQFGLAVDHKKISVAQVDDDSPLSWSTGRLRLLGVRLASEASTAEAEVKISFDEVVHSGRASGPSSSVSCLRVAAQATLSAIASYFNSTHQFSLDDVVVLEVRTKRIALTVMSLLTPGGEETLIGTSLVRGTEADAAARSVLDAVNRRFALIVRRPGSRQGRNGVASHDLPDV